jgi:hypothetical protein
MRGIRDVEESAIGAIAKTQLRAEARKSARMRERSRSPSFWIGGASILEFIAGKGEIYATIDTRESMYQYPRA